MIVHSSYFILSESGYTVLCLKSMGNSSDSEWAVWEKQLGVSERELLIAANKVLSNPWKQYDGLHCLLTGDEIIEWVAIGIRRAETVEELIMNFNSYHDNMLALHLVCGLRDKDQRPVAVFNSVVQTTREFDGWIERVKSSSEYKDGYPVVTPSYYPVDWDIETDPRW